MAVQNIRRHRVQGLAAIGAATLALSVGAPPALATTAAPSGHRLAYRQINLVSDVPGLAKITDPNVKNPWGVSFGVGAINTPLWVANEGTSTTTLYRGAAGPNPISTVPLVVKTQPAPTGTVFNDTSEFLMPNGAPATFLFDSLSGSISGWQGSNPPATATQTLKSRRGAAFTGLALAHTPMGARLLAADAAGGVVRVYDGTFHQVGQLADHNLPAGMAPYNVAVLGNHIYVSYAGEGVPGGAVDVYTMTMERSRRLITGGVLNGPWGMAVAPAHWGPFSNALLVGNEDGGRINAFNRVTGAFLGTLKDEHGMPIENDGLWGMQFGNGVIGTRHTLIIAAGIDGYQHGLIAGIRYGEPS